ncbi:hypothetical protein RJ640_006267 [Escallonia rubra]|uniref:Retrotransposon gag domain-containing protein n=1 Tax=Escallonia rubra TaxID=112253 RepID=A0AA88RIQ4_9ASTE|nr:hypothetical protein RJ640_006267 [Escallonia rubra]
MLDCKVEYSFQFPKNSAYVIDNESDHVRDAENELNHSTEEESDRSSDGRRPELHRESGVQVHLAEFDGDMEPEGFLDWMDSIESYIDWQEVTEGRKMKRVGPKLRGPASTWWKHYPNYGDSRRKPKIQRWDKMKEKLKAQFLPRDYNQTLYQRVQNLRQHENLLAVSLEGLFTSATTMLQLAEQITPIVVVVQLFPCVLNNKQTPTVGELSKGDPIIRVKWLENVSGVLSLDTTLTNVQKELIFGLIFRRTKRLDLRSTLLILKVKTTWMHESQKVFDEEGIEGDVVGEALVFRHSMLAPPANNQHDWLRKNIFRARCTGEGKLCNLIIDSGSSGNLISEEMVDKLNFKTKRHPQPYRILWFNKGNEVMVSSTCLVNFSIGPFKEAVYCDVVPMNACHILLGRPWKYD